MLDPWLMVVDKPAGLLTQPGLGPDQQDSVITRLQRKEHGLRLVHRLDRDTSGVLLLARSADALRRLSALFAERRINKLYQADVEGELLGRGCIASPLARLSRQPPRYGRHPEGRLALTLWKVCAACAHGTRIWLRPLTGRSHQLRAHLAELGHPIVGDPIYGDAARSFRLHLHSQALSFRHPFTHRRVRLISQEVPFATEF
uniref:RluA family pseudouridine synthase n=1 Tax=Synechococcus sp. UW106 TaxID=368495 RepID=UPI001FCA74C9|nr:RluA family pseudouridine synthase [Synechococcus sp. UW106]